MWSPPPEEDYLVSDSVSPLRPPTRSGVLEKRNTNVPPAHSTAMRKTHVEVQPHANTDLIREVKKLNDQLAREQREKANIQEKLSELTSITARRREQDAADARRRMREDGANERREKSEIHTKFKEQCAVLEATQRDLHAAEAQTERLAKELDECRDELARANERCDEFETMHADVQRQLDKAHVEIADLKAAMSIQRSENEEAVSSNRRLMAEKQRAEGDSMAVAEMNETLKISNRSLADELCEANSLAAELRSRLDESGTELANKTQELNMLRSEVDSLKSHLRSANGNSATASEENSMLRGHVNNLQSEVSELTQQRDEAKRVAKMEIEEAQCLRGRVEALGQQLDDKTREANDAAQRLRTAESSLSHIQSMAEGFRDREAKFQNDIDVMRSQVQRLEDARDNLNRQLEAANATLEMESGLAQQRRDDNAELKLRIQSQEGNIETLTCDLEANKQRLVAEQERCTTIEQALRRAHEDVSKYEAAANTSSDALAQVKAELASLKIQLASTNEELSALQSANERKDKDISILREQLTRSHVDGAELQRVQQHATAMEQQVEYLQTQVATLRTDKLKFSDDLEAERRNFSALALEKDCLARNVSELRVILDGKTTEAKELVLNLDTTQRRVDELGTELGNALQAKSVQECLRKSAEERVAALEPQLASAQATAAAEAQRTLQLQSQLDEARANLAATTTRVAALESELANTKAMLMSVSESNTRETAERSALQVRNQELENRCEKLHGELIGVQADAEKTSEALQRSSSRVLSLESDLKSSTADLSDARAQIGEYMKAQENDRDTIRKLERSADEAKKVVSDLTSEVRGLEDSLRAIREENDGQAEVVRRLTGDLSRAQSAHKALEKSKEDADERIQVTQSELQHQIIANETILKQLEVCRDELRISTKNVSVLQSEVSALSQSLVASQQTVQMLETSLAREKRNTADQVSGMAALNHQLEGVVSERDTLRYKLGDLEARLKRADATCERQSEQLEGLESQLKRAQSQVRAEKSEHQKYKAQVAHEWSNKHRELDDKDSEIAVLRSSRQDLEGKLDEVRGKVFLLERENEEIYTKSKDKVRTAVQERDTHIQKYHTACWEYSAISREFAEYKKNYAIECDLHAEERKQLAANLEQQKTIAKEQHAKLLRHDQTYEQRLEKKDRELRRTKQKLEQFMSGEVSRKRVKADDEDNNDEDEN